MSNTTGFQDVSSVPASPGTVARHASSTTESSLRIVEFDQDEQEAHRRYHKRRVCRLGILEARAREDYVQEEDCDLCSSVRSAEGVRHLG